jgi:hypothetical protein
MNVLYPQGDEIFDNYGCFYQMSSLEERRSRLQRQYFFKCECRACKSDWALATDVRGSADVFICPRNISELVETQKFEFCRLNTP